jgi:hypothetical protein
VTPPPTKTGSEAPTVNVVTGLFVEGPLMLRIEASSLEELELSWKRMQVMMKIFLSESVFEVPLQ